MDILISHGRFTTMQSIAGLSLLRSISGKVRISGSFDQAFTLPAFGVGKVKAMTANERRRQIMFYLNDYRKATCPILAEYFHVSVKTIRIDIEILTCEYPIISKQGKYGGISVSDGWRYDRRYLSDCQDDLLRTLYSTLDDEEKKIMESILKAFSRHGQIDKN